MMESLGRVFPGLSKPAAGLRHRPIFSKTLMLVFVASFLMASCGPRIARVAVSDEDRIEANRLAQKGHEAYMEGDYYAALIKYLMACELNPNSEYISNHVGMAYLRLEYNKEAIEAFQRSIALNSKYPYSLHNLGSAYFADRNFKKAEKYYKKAIKLKKDEAIFHMNLGTLYFEKKKPEKAFEEWRRSLSLDPEILSKTNPLNMAISDKDIPLQDRYYYMARIYAAAGNIPKAIESLENALLQGFTDIELIKENPEFDPIRNDARFVKFMESAFVWAKSKEPSPTVEE